MSRRRALSSRRSSKRLESFSKRARAERLRAFSFKTRSRLNLPTRYVLHMSKSELLEQLAALSREELDEVADRVDSLRGGDITPDERTLIRDRISDYRANPND